MSDELRLAVVLVAVHGLAEDVPLLHAVRETSLHTRCELWELPQDAAGAAEWARSLDAECFGQDVASEPEFTWIGLARRQGLTEHVRVALIRMLDDTGPDAERLSRELELTGDFAQAVRAQRNLVSLQDTAWDRAATGQTLARLERSSGDLAGAWRTLERVRAALGLDKPEPEPVPEQLVFDLGVEGPAEDTSAEHWHRRGLGRMITEEHLRLALAAVGSGDVELARVAMAHGKTLLKLIGKRFRKELSPLSTEAKWAVAGLKGS